MELKLSSRQIKVLSGIFASVGHIFFASGVIPFLLWQAVPEKPLALLFALIASLSCWFFSILLVKGLQ